MEIPQSGPAHDESALQDLVASASEGDGPALDELLERLVPQLHAYMRLHAGGRVLGRESSADLAQSVCREVLEGMGALEWRGEARFRAWLFTLARRKIAQRHRHMHRRKREVGREVAGTGAGEGPGNGPGELSIAEAYARLSSPSQHLIAAELLERMDSAFARMDEAYREVILLSRVLGLSRREVAEQMGRSENSVRMLLARALSILASEVDYEPE